MVTQDPRHPTGEGAGSSSFVLPPVLVIAGPTASGKSALAMHVAEAFGGEIVSCDSVAVYRELDVGSAKPSVEDRARVVHHGLDLLNPDEASNAGDYARHARDAFAAIAARGRLPILAGGTGLYVRATLDGLAPAPVRDEDLRERLRRHASRYGQAALHRLLRRVDPDAAATIHPNDTPKLIRSLEVAILGNRPQTVQWQAGRDPLEGYRVLQIGLDPPRPALYEHINSRAAGMFSTGLLEETAGVISRYGTHARALGSLGYLQARAVLEGKQQLPAAIAEAQQGHRNYAKRQLTWFRREPRMEWFYGFGDVSEVQNAVLHRMEQHLKPEEQKDGV